MEIEFFVVMVYVQMINPRMEPTFFSFSIILNSNNFESK